MTKVTNFFRIPVTLDYWWLIKILILVDTPSDEDVGDESDGNESDGGDTGYVPFVLMTKGKGNKLQLKTLHVWKQKIFVF